MKKFLFITTVLMIITGCHTNCPDCNKEQLPCCEKPVVAEPAPVARHIPVVNPCPQTIVQPPVVEQVAVPMNRVTTTYKVIEYRKPAFVCDTVDCANRPVRYRSTSRHVLKPVSEPIKYVAPQGTTYYTEDDYIKQSGRYPSARVLLWRSLLEKTMLKPITNYLKADTYLLKLKHYVNSEDNLKYGTNNSWCFDICAAISESVILKAGERHVFPTGVKFILPSPLWCRLCPRSGLAVKHGITVLGGLIDNDYRGEPLVCLLNTGKEDYVVNPGDRIAQVELPFPYRVNFIEITEEEYNKQSTERGENGFGSTGK